MTVEVTPAKPPKGRLIAGVAVFALGWIATLALVPVITASALPSSLAGIVVFVGPKLGVLAAVAIMGRPGFVYLKAKVFGLLQPPADVGPTRYRVGIVMFVAALVLGFLEPYGFFAPQYGARGIRVSLAVDLLLVASIFVLGAGFWDKIRALFVREARVYFPDSVRG
jgi:hypothetical protein